MCKFVHLADSRHYRLQYQPQRKERQRENTQKRQQTAEAKMDHGRAEYLWTTALHNFVVAQRSRRRPTATDTHGRYRSAGTRSEEHTSELQSLMRNSYAVFCLKKQ